MKFKVGDVCEVITSDNEPRHLGATITITAVYPADTWPYKSDRKAYSHAGCVRFAEYALRLKRPPNYLRKTSWDKCIWKPSGVTA